MCSPPERSRSPMMPSSAQWRPMPFRRSRSSPTASSSCAGMRWPLSKSQRTVYYTGLLPNVDLTSLISTLEDNQVEFSGEIVENSTFTFLFSWVLFPLLMLALLSLLMRFIISRSGGGSQRLWCYWQHRQEQGQGLYGKGDRRDVPRCRRSGRSEGIACRDHRFSAQSAEICRHRCEAAEGARCLSAPRHLLFKAAKAHASNRLPGAPMQLPGSGAFPLLFAGVQEGRHRHFSLSTSVSPGFPCRRNRPPGVGGRRASAYALPAPGGSLCSFRSLFRRK